MRTASASQLLAVATALCAVVLFGACKTTSERWYKGTAGKTEWEQNLDQTVQKNIDTMNALARGDDEVSYVGSTFDKKADASTKTSLFGKKEARTKDYRTKDFAGAADEYKSSDYHFLKRQNFKEKSFGEQDDVYTTGEAPDNKRLFLGRNKRARTKDYADDNKSFQTGSYKTSAGSPNIVKDDAREADAALTVDDVRTILHGPK